MDKDSSRHFEWLLGSPRTLLSSLRDCRTAIKRGWLDGAAYADRRAALLAALQQLLEQEPRHSSGRGVIAVAKIYAVMTEADLDAAIDELTSHSRS
jgi:hypothetical protein